VFRFLNPFRQARGLFRFHDGTRWRHADPIVAVRGLFTSPGFDWDETPLLLVQSGNAVQQLRALASISTAMRTVLELPTVEDGGLTELECWTLFQQLNDMLGGLKKNGSLFPILPNDTDSMPSVPLDFPTKPSSVSGSISTEPSPAPPSSIPEPMPDDSAAA
jgi:hypothetical protein